MKSPESQKNRGNVDLFQQCMKCGGVLIWPMSPEQYKISRELNLALGGFSYFKPMEAKCIECENNKKNEDRRDIISFATGTLLLGFLLVALIIYLSK